MTDGPVPDIERYRGYLRLLAEMELNPRLRVKEDASDLVQQTYLEAHRDLPGYRGSSDAELLAWLKTILARNLWNTARHYRTQKCDIRREQAAAEQLDRSTEQIANFLACEQFSPSQEAVQNEQQVRLAHAMSQLLDGERTAIILKHFQGQSLSDIGQQMGRPIDAVAGLLKRGLKKLRAQLNEEVEL